MRIEADRKDLPMITKQGEAVAEYLKKLGYVYITLDLEGFRSGSMDVEKQESLFKGDD